jgi:hypothetical protein
VYRLVKKLNDNTKMSRKHSTLHLHFSPGRLFAGFFMLRGVKMRRKVTKREKLLLKKLNCYGVALEELSELVKYLADSYYENYGKEEGILSNRFKHLRGITAFFLDSRWQDNVEYGIKLLLNEAQKRSIEYQLATGELGVVDVAQSILDWEEVIKIMEEDRKEVCNNEI